MRNGRGDEGVARQPEVERKYALRPRQELPGLDGIGAAGPATEFELVATYFDTPELALTRAGISLRRRVGGHDDGWHLKLARDEHDRRLELQATAAGERPPAALREQVAEVLADGPLVPVAVLRTRRREWPLLAAGGATLALVCVDDVKAEAPGSTMVWREAEVELVHAGPGLLDVVDRVLAGAGIGRAAASSKVGRALADAVAALRPPGAGSDAREVVLSYVAKQVGTLQGREADVLADAPDAVHRCRVATRRLRSTLRTYSDVLDWPSRIRDELRWLGEELGAPRDAEVLRERLLADVAELPDGRGEPVRRLIDAALTRAHDEAMAALVAAMGSGRHERLQVTLAALLAPRAPVPATGTPAGEVLPGLLERTLGRVARAVERAEARPGDLTRWHEVRKAAKAARYGAEVLVPVLGEPAERLREAWEQVTETLGEVQDAVVARHVLGELAPAAVAAGVPRLPFDDLRFLQDRRLQEALGRARQALAAALPLRVDT